MRATVIDLALDQQIRSQHNYPDGPIVIAIKLYNHAIAAITDADATEHNPDQDSDAAFKQEIAIMSSLQGHELIATMFGYMDGEVVGLVMKLYASSLYELILNVNEWPILPIADITQQIASGLAEMHSSGIIHCDIKKNNILYNVDERGMLHTYITDFGVS